MREFSREVAGVLDLPEDIEFLRERHSDMLACCDVAILKGNVGGALHAIRFHVDSLGLSLREANNFRRVRREYLVDKGYLEEPAEGEPLIFNITEDGKAYLELLEECRKDVAGEVEWAC